MLQKSCFATILLLGLTSLGCQTPHGGCAGGCCSSSCGTGAGYAPASQTYAPAVSPNYAPIPQQALPPAFSGGGGSGSR